MTKQKKNVGLMLNSVVKGPNDMTQLSLKESSFRASLTYM